MLYIISLKRALNFFTDKILHHSNRTGCLAAKRYGLCVLFKSIVTSRDNYNDANKPGEARFCF